MSDVPQDRDGYPNIAGHGLGNPGLPISNRIKELRAAKDDMSQLQLARCIGVTRQTVNAIELGKYSPSLEVAFRIARVFDLPLEKVFTYHSDQA